MSMTHEELACCETIDVGGRRLLAANLGLLRRDAALELAERSQYGLGAVWYRGCDGQAHWYLRAIAGFTGPGCATEAGVGAIARLFGGGGTAEEAVFTLAWPKHCALLGWWGVNAAEREQAGWSEILGKRPASPAVPEGYCLASGNIAATDFDGMLVEGPGPGLRFVDGKALRTLGVEAAYAAAALEDPRVQVYGNAVRSAWDMLRDLDSQDVLAGDETLPEGIAKVFNSGSYSPRFVRP